jgi:hypothetical protein
MQSAPEFNYSHSCGVDMPKRHSSFFGGDSFLSGGANPSLQSLNFLGSPSMRSLHSNPSARSMNLEPLNALEEEDEESEPSFPSSDTNV